MVPLSYNYRNLRVRWKTTLMTASGFTLVVAALVVMLAFINGIEAACATTGEPENVILLSKGNNDEVLSQMERGLVSQVENTRGVALDSASQPIASRELYMVVHHRNERTGDFRFLQVRGVLPVAFRVHTQLHIREGRSFRPSQSEVLIGKAVQRENHFQIGDLIEMGRKHWKIVGVFEAGGAAFESELWCDLNELASQFRREGMYSSVILRAPGSREAEELAEQLSGNRSISVEAMTEPKYYQKQSEQTKIMQTAAWVIAWFMGVGAMFGVMNTMFAAIGQRTKDIAVLRIMGFESGEILLSFLMEAILISLIGGLLGVALGAATNGLTRSASIGARQIDFAFRVDVGILAFAALFSVIMGILGGLLPALSAMRIKPLEALR
ncbi:MAG TPA: FtsX-like permease family protein [Gemmataceae bacterium]|nr:FtsX-like permease family protein [Gemmataceae bacterium]